MLGILSTQLGFLGHDAGHRQVPGLQSISLG
jgi:hypothetical protein